MQHTLHCARPSPPLRGFLRAFAQREVASTAAPIIEPVPARLDSTLEFPVWRGPSLTSSMDGQMHLIHDFHELAGGAPESVLHDIGDIRPPAFVAD